MPLSSGGLCDALITTPAEAPRSTVVKAIAGVGSTPASSTSPPAERMPSVSASSSHTPEARGSRPTTTTARPAPWRPSTVTAARPSPAASSAVSSVPATPRTPSVPNSRAHRAAT